MPDNRRRHANTVPIAKFVTFLVIGIFACVAGLAYVWCKNDLFAMGAQIRKLEAELVQLRSRNEATMTNIAKLKSTSELDKRHSQGWIKMVAIPPGGFVVVGSAAKPAGAGELRAVANGRKIE